MVKYSFIVAVYNISKYINRCMDSLLNQTIKDYEIIVVNDGSTDDSLEKIRKYEQVIKIVNKENGGLASARNKGMEVATGEYCVFIDGDDFVKRDYLEIFDKKIAKNNTLDIVMGGYTSLNNNKEKKVEYNDLLNIVQYQNIYLKMIGPSSKESSFKRYTMSVWGKCYRRKFLIDNHISFKSERQYISEDLVFHTDILRFKPTISFVINVGYVYVNNDYESLTRIYKEDRILREIELHNYLLVNTPSLSNLDKYRLYYNFLERFDGVLRKLLIQNKDTIAMNALSCQELDNAINYCSEFPKTIKAKIRIFYLKKKNMLLLKIIAKIRR